MLVIINTIRNFIAVMIETGSEWLGRWTICTGNLNYRRGLRDSINLKFIIIHQMRCAEYWKRPPRYVRTVVVVLEKLCYAAAPDKLRTHVALQALHIGLHGKTFSIGSTIVPR